MDLFLQLDILIPYFISRLGDPSASFGDLLVAALRHASPPLAGSSLPLEMRSDLAQGGGGRTTVTAHSDVDFKFRSGKRHRSAYHHCDLHP